VPRIERLTIPKLGVNALVIVLGLAGEGVMESRPGPHDVAWYDFTARPGTGSNAVFAGHSLWADPNPNAAPAVFLRLNELAAGDLIAVRLSDGTVLEYSMGQAEVFAGDYDVDQIVGPANHDMITLITCGGSEPQPRRCAAWLVVRADRR
jgi:LPXTG-site transpeptidase (sortase) family protein